MAKYSRFDPSNKKKSRDKNTNTEKLKSSKIKKFNKVDSEDWEEYDQKFNLQNVMKNIK
jgi:hypothetical protein